MQNNILKHKIKRDVKFIFWLFFYFSLISIGIIQLGYSFLGENDDWVLWYFLSAGESGTLIMSYPLSSVISYLYRYVPDINWYSWVMFVYISLISFLAAYHIERVKDRSIIKLLIIIVSMMLIYTWMNITITMVTLLLIAMSAPFIRIDPIKFWILLTLAGLLRVDLIISIAPIFILTYLILFRKNLLTPKKVILVFTLLSTLIATHISVSLDQEYKDWLTFVKARGYFVDLHGEDKLNILSEDEEFISRTWWIGDDSLLSTQKVIDAASSSSIDIISSSFSNLEPIELLKTFAHSKLLFFLIFITALLIYREEKYYNKGVYTLFLIAVMTLIIVRDTERVTYPLIFLWSILIFMKLAFINDLKLLKKSLIITSFILLVELPIGKIYKYNQNAELKDEAVELMAKYPDMKYASALGFPRSFGKLSIVLREAHLFDEKNWLSFEKNGILLAGWPSRHPYFYKTHNISFNNVKRKFDNFYQFMIDEHSAFIGTKDVDEEFNKKILNLYDLKYGTNGINYHRIKVLDESKNFSLTKIIKVDR